MHITKHVSSPEQFLTNSESFDRNTQVYYPASNTGLVWQTWTKPPGVHNVLMVIMSSGGAGGGAINTSANSGGGGGGGGGMVCSLFVPAMFIPDTLYLAVGPGGEAPDPITSGFNLGAAKRSVIAVEPFDLNNISSFFYLILLHAYGGTGGGAATATLAGAGGTAVVTSFSDASLAGLGIYANSASSVGLAGGTPGSPTATSLNIGIVTTSPFGHGGTGGGGRNSVANTGGRGGQITGYTTPMETGNVAGGSNTGSLDLRHGNPGGLYITRNFWYPVGGTGGGGASEGIAPGNGGDGGICGGGGGAGAGGNAFGLSRPGKGGDGFIIISSWA